MNPVSADPAGDATCTLSEAAVILAISEGAVLALCSARELRVIGKRPRRFLLADVQALRHRLAGLRNGMHPDL